MKPKKYSGARYAMERMLGTKMALTFHPAHFEACGRMYRCTCMPTFRLPGGKRGPHSANLKRSGAKVMAALSRGWKRNRTISILEIAAASKEMNE